MKRLLHVIASPREEESRTLKLSRAFMASFEASHPGWVTDTLDLFREELPPLAMKRADGRYLLLDGKGLHGSLKERWHEILAHIERFSSADSYVISAPMWNFSIPYVLKQYIDLIVQPNFTFRYREDGGVEGLVTGKKMAVMTSRGGSYTTPDEKGYDFQEPYLRLIMGFIGIRDITFVVAEPMDSVPPEVVQERLRAAVIRAEALGAEF